MNMRGVIATFAERATNLLVQNQYLLVQRWFKMKNNFHIKQSSLQIEPTELTEPTCFYRT